MTDHDTLIAHSAEKKFLRIRHVVAKVQKEFDDLHAWDMATDVQRRAMTTAEKHGIDYTPAFNIAMMACAMAGYEFEWLAEKSRRGHLLRGDRCFGRAKVWALMRLHGLSLPEIAHVFGTSHSSVWDVLRDLPEPVVPAKVVRFGSAA